MPVPTRQSRLVVAKTEARMVELSRRKNGAGGDDFGDGAPGIPRGDGIGRHRPTIAGGFYRGGQWSGRTAPRVDALLFLRPRGIRPTGDGVSRREAGV